jgi:hypothetical protein
VELRGEVTVKGPVVARGDLRLNPLGKKIKLFSGLTVNGSVNCLPHPESAQTLQDGMEHAGVIVKGDISINQSIALKNAIVFGSVHAVSCSLENSLLLGTGIIEESLRVTMSSLGGYASRDVSFEGECLLLHAIGESSTQPLFLPFERTTGDLIACDLRYYPAARLSGSIMNRRRLGVGAYPIYSRLYPETDWVCAKATANHALQETRQEPLTKWILSIGGRVSDISIISQAIVNLGAMLKCGFEYEHYHPSIRGERLKKALAGLTAEERWILEAVCS